MHTISVRVIVLGASKTEAALTPQSVGKKIRVLNEMVAHYDLRVGSTSQGLQITRQFFVLPKWRWWSVLSCAYRWFKARAPEDMLTAFVVKKMEGREGWCNPFSNWFIVSSTAGSSAWLHEMLHLAGQWTHDSDPENVMHWDIGWKIRPDQIERLKRWKFAKAEANAC